jgi:hypothetical protein
MIRYLLAGLALLPLAAFGQIVPTSPGQQRAAARQAQREARRTESPYEDSHLAAAHQAVRRGHSERPTRVANEPRFDRDGRPHVTEPRFPGLRRRPKTEPNP